MTAVIIRSRAVELKYLAGPESLFHKYNTMIAHRGRLERMGAEVVAIAPHLMQQPKEKARDGIAPLRCSFTVAHGEGALTVRQIPLIALWRNWSCPPFVSRPFTRHPYAAPSSERRMSMDLTIPIGHDYIHALWEDAHIMTNQQYPRSPNVLLGGIAHLARFIDKVRLRHEGQIQDYNYLTTGFDKQLIEFLEIDPDTFAERVLTGKTDEELLEWVRHHGRQVTGEEINQWSAGLLSSGPKDEAARQRFQGRLTDVAMKRGIPVERLPNVTTWVDVIELDEGRL